jgi:hypothetical protein
MLRCFHGVFRPFCFSFENSFRATMKALMALGHAAGVFISTFPPPEGDVPSVPVLLLTR